MNLKKTTFISAMFALLTACGNNDNVEKFNGVWSGENPEGNFYSYIIQHREDDNFIVEINTGMWKGSSYEAVMINDNTLQHVSMPSHILEYNESDETLHITDREVAFKKESE